MKIGAAFPAKAEFLFQPHPYKVMEGGRGSSKTWDFCRALLILGMRKPLFILCAREIQKSIGESVHRVLATQIDAFDIGWAYDVQASRILGSNGTEFVFAGIRNNIASIKSMEGIDICAVFEATFVSKHSWDTLLPTVRGDPPRGPFSQGSEVWVEFNPELGTDETYKRWVLNPPDGTKVVEVNWRDNPWFPDFLRKQKDAMRKADYENYLTIWEGKVRRVLQGAIYAKEIELAQKDQRISPHIKYDKSKPVDISADLGRNDLTALWFSQQVGNEHRFIDYYGNFGFDWSHYLGVIQNGIADDPKRRYQIGTIYLPHDAKMERIEAPKSIWAQTRDAYPGEGRVRIVPRVSNQALEINQVRMMFPRFVFNEVFCADGLMALSHFRYQVDTDKLDSAGKPRISPEPLHDWASHGARALGCYAMGLKDNAKKAPQMYAPPEPQHYEHGQGWMAG